MADYKQLCAELVNELHAYKIGNPSHDTDLIDRARAALAEPAQEGPTDEELLSLDQLRDTWNAQADAANSWDELGVDEIIWWAQRQALARWGRPAPQPVQVSERLPGAEDCDAEGRCWIHMPDIGTAPSWRLVDPREIGPYHTHWLPANALPIPSESD